ncbi:MAG: TIGR04282 family arsenosugar biosynthesis glycosyltransferase [Candidatus Nitrotoga sp.]|nr:TIGR04282 family arsenosugar biosynthesis glycosyltransferase [Candidatus Nitrotoga sp.]
MTRIIIFAKAPQPGFAKTRLIPALGQEGAARLARRMLEETLCSAIEAEIGPVELCTTPEIASPFWLGVNISNGVKISTQGDGDLGARLARAVQRGIENGDSVLLIGTDCVEMSTLLLREAAASLEHNVAVIHPTTDGGYALLGLTQFHPLLFKDVAWSTNCVALETISRIEQLGWSLQIGALLHDVDEPEDLMHVPANWLWTCHA